MYMYVMRFETTDLGVHNFIYNFTILFVFGFFSNQPERLQCFSLFITSTKTFQYIQHFTNRVILIEDSLQRYMSKVRIIPFRCPLVHCWRMRLRIKKSVVQSLSVNLWTCLVLDLHSPLSSYTLLNIYLYTAILSTIIDRKFNTMPFQYFATICGRYETERMLSRCV